MEIRKRIGRRMTRRYMLESRATYWHVQSNGNIVFEVSRCFRLILMFNTNILKNNLKIPKDQNSLDQKTERTMANKMKQKSSIQNTTMKTIAGVT